MLNDPMAIVLFETFKAGSISSSRDLAHTLANFLSILWGAVGFGLLFGLAASFITKHADFHARPRPAMEVPQAAGAQRAKRTDASPTMWPPRAGQGSRGPRPRPRGRLRRRWVRAAPGKGGSLGSRGVGGPR